MYHHNIFHPYWGYIREVSGNLLMITWDNVAYNIHKQDLAPELNPLLHPDNGGGSRMFGIWQSTSGLKNKKHIIYVDYAACSDLIMTKLAYFWY